MGLDDDEDPRLRVRFVTEQERPKPQEVPTKPKIAFVDKETKDPRDFKETIKKEISLKVERVDPKKIA
jgi:hypothetical protein